MSYKKTYFQMAVEHKKHGANHLEIGELLKSEAHTDFGNRHLEAARRCHQIHFLLTQRRAAEADRQIKRLKRFNNTAGKPPIGLGKGGAGQKKPT